MMPAAKHFDPVLGVDIHIIQPPGPVPPVPIPHPFVGFLIDPFDYVPILGGTVKVNGMMRAQAGTAGKCVPAHIPIGGVFVKPPANECEMFMGSSTVEVDGDAFSYLALPALSCQDIGMPPIPRLKKKSKIKSLLLPTSVVLPIPAGPPVLVGGAPTISLMALGMKLGMAALGKAFKKLKKLQKASKRWKKFSDKVQAAAKKAMDKLGIPPSVQNMIHKAICSVTGHPVDVATGKVLTDCVDVELPGQIPLRWERSWYSTSSYDGPFGHGWHHCYDVALVEIDGAVAVRMVDGRPIAFPALPVGSEHYDRTEKLTLLRRAEGYALRERGGLQYHFAPRPSARGEQPLDSVRDGAGNAITFAYDGAGHLQGLRDSAGRALRVATDQRGRIVQIIGPHPEREDQSVVLAAYAYSEQGDLIRYTDAVQQSFRYAYQDHLLLSESDRSGMTFYFEYDRPGTTARCLRTWGDGGLYDHKLTYDVDAGITVVEDSLGFKTTYHHSGGLVYLTIDALGNAQSIERNEFNEITKVTDALGHAIEHKYDDRGNLIEIKEPHGAVQKAVYDVHDRVIEATDPLGGKWLRTHDAAGRPIEEVDALGRVVCYAYDNGKLVLHVDAGGRETTLRYDHESNLAAVVFPDGSVQRWEYDRLGRPVLEIDARGNVQKRAYDLAGRAVRVTEADGHTHELAYDPEGRLAHLRNKHHDVHYTFAGMGRLVSRAENGAEIRFDYDTEERLVAIHNEHGSVFRFVLDPLGDVIEEDGFDGLRMRYVRDAARRVIQVERPGGIITECKYDAIDRLIEKKHSTGEIERYAYRLDDQLMEAANNTAVVRFERDIIGRITKEVQNLGWIESSYDAVGNRQSLCSSTGMKQVNRRNVMGNVTSVEAGANGRKPSVRSPAKLEVNFQLDVLGVELERALPGGVRARWQRDRMGRPVRQEITTAGAPRIERAYTWDLNDRLKMIVNSQRGPVSFQHDALGNLAAVLHQNRTTELRMPDAVGNLFRTEQRTDRKYGAAGQLLKSRGPNGITHYEYDAEGNLLRKTNSDGRTWSYAWNAEGMLTGVVRPNGDVVEFAYDVLGRRVWKRCGERTQRWLWDGNVPFHEWEENGHGPASPVTWIFEPESFTPLGKIVGERRYGIVVDQLDTPTRMYNDFGELVWSAEYGAYGELVDVQGDRYECAFRWPGQYEDPETGLYYNRFRYYDPDSGEYISQDPWGVDAGLRFYAYVADPVIEFDPFGLVKGGSYSAVRGSNSRGQVHHMPANSVSPHSTGSGPTIYMSKADHLKTASHGSQGAAGAAYRAKQATHIQNGDFAKAMEMDIKDIKDIKKKFGNKYDDAMKQAIEYAAAKGMITKAEGTKLKKHCK